MQRPLTGTVALVTGVSRGLDTQVRALFERIEQENGGRLDVLVNNVYGGVRALRQGIGRPFWESEPGLWDTCNAVGLRSHCVASVHAARLMLPRRRGLICTISSWGGLTPLFSVAYGLGKAACGRASWPPNTSGSWRRRTARRLPRTRRCSRWHETPTGRPPC